MVTFCFENNIYITLKKIISGVVNLNISISNTFRQILTSTSIYK